MVAQSPFSSIQMSNSPIHANVSNVWGMNPSVPNSVVSATEQTPLGYTNSHQNPRSMPMESMTSRREFMLMSLHKERETRVKTLTAAVQKYKVKRDSKSFEEQLQKPDNDLLNLPSTFPSSLLPATAMIEKGKVEHYKGFYSEVQTEEHVLKVFDDMSMKKEGIVSVRLVPNNITLPTSAPFLDQKKAILGKVKPMTDVASVSCVNFWRLQEA
ncbi:beta-ureidopropionase [Iris pallida]|uniref:Beta-ureidopropionase n=1 Tax=Iris pallida TaxID=29817 RepID=A0AAX6ESZ7_IRIPA|nr:beta-ureidopropionase [Iris pallida]